MKNIVKIFALIALVTIVISCRKTEDNLNVDFSTFNADNPTTNTPLDQWLKANFLDEYNIEVIYRYNRYYHGNTANVVPNKLENIQPTMQIVLDGFIGPYRKIGGETFTKTYMPKEWVLFGSYSYANTADPGVAGTAAAGRRITLYGVNEYQPLPAGQFYAWDRHRIMHHEFGHILNQIIPIPTDWESISKGFYKQPYDQTPLVDAHNNGFVTSYASGQPTEDYAETISWLLINGQAWYDYWTLTAATADGKVRLTQKELNVINYYNNLGLDFKALQREVQLYMKNTLNLKESKFSYWLGQKLYTSITMNLESDLYTKYGKSTDFETPYNQMKAAILAYSSTAKYHMDNLQIRFDSPTAMTVRIPFTAAAGGTQFSADYNFSYTIDANTGDMTFTKVAQLGTTGNYSNAALFAATFTTSIQAYLTGKTFVADWMPVAINADGYMKYGGLSVKGTPTNYFYGPLAY
jgi:substrate import-associated zinc metallohydrolase lipoprotein